MPFRPRPAMRRHSNRAPRGGGAPTLSDEWRAWVTENALRSVPREGMLATLSANGVPRKLGEREMDAVLASPLFAGATRVSNRAKRRELRARLERETALLAHEPHAIARRSRVSAEEFFDRYYATGTPVVLTDTFTTWPSLAGWSPSAFRERIGHTEVSVTSGRASDPASHTHFGKDCAVMPMADLCDRVVAAGATNDFYLISNDLPPSGAGLSPLLADLRAPHPYLDDQRDESCMILWFGPAGTVTYLATRP